MAKLHVEVLPLTLQTAVGAERGEVLGELCHRSEVKAAFILFFFLGICLRYLLCVSSGIKPFPHDQDCQQMFIRT